MAVVLINGCYLAIAIYGTYVRSTVRSILQLKFKINFMPFATRTVQSSKCNAVSVVECAFVYFNLCVFIFMKQT